MCVYDENTVIKMPLHPSTGNVARQLPLKQNGQMIHFPSSKSKNKHIK